MPECACVPVCVRVHVRVCEKQGWGEAGWGSQQSWGDKEVGRGARVVLTAPPGRTLQMERPGGRVCSLSSEDATVLQPSRRHGNAQSPQTASSQHARGRCSL